MEPSTSTATAQPASRQNSFHASRVPSRRRRAVSFFAGVTAPNSHRVRSSISHRVRSSSASRPAPVRVRITPRGDAPIPPVPPVASPVVDISTHIFVHAPRVRRGFHQMRSELFRSFRESVVPVVTRSVCSVETAGGTTPRSSLKLIITDHRGYRPLPFRRSASMVTRRRNRSALPLLPLLPRKPVQPEKRGPRFGGFEHVRHRAVGVGLAGTRQRRLTGHRGVGSQKRSQRAGGWDREGRQRSTRRNVSPIDRGASRRHRDRFFSSVSVGRVSVSSSVMKTHREIATTARKRRGNFPKQTDALISTRTHSRARRSCPTHVVVPTRRLRRRATVLEHL